MTSLLDQIAAIFLTETGRFAVDSEGEVILILTREGVRDLQEANPDLPLVVGVSQGGMQGTTAQFQASTPLTRGMGVEHDLQRQSGAYIRPARPGGHFIGVVTENAREGTKVRVSLDGSVAVALDNPVIGAPVYLDPYSPGQLTTVRPSTAVVVQVGVVQQDWGHGVGQIILTSQLHQ